MASDQGLYCLPCHSISLVASKMGLQFPFYGSPYMNALTCTYRHIAALCEGCGCCTDMNVLLCEGMLQLENKTFLLII